MIKPTPSTLNRRTQQTQSFDAVLTLIAETAEDLRLMGEYSEDEARRIATMVVKGECMRYGGDRRYTPVWPHRQERDEAIRAEFNGCNSGDVCRKYNISRTSLYRIVNRRALGKSPVSCLKTAQV
jgi:Mor family transcriptional regulator